MRSFFPLLLLLVTVALLSSCRRDQLFTDSPDARLNFSQDTVLFDTIFTTVPFSVTKRFVARNPGNRAVRVNIALEGGSPSPFRINVDGSSGILFEGVEIGPGDSVYVFVEASLDQTNQNSPLIHEDHILFNTNGNEQKVLLVAWGQDAHFFYPNREIQGFPPFQIIAGVDDQGNGICETVTWQNDKPYVIYGYAVVDSCSTLRIDPGVRVYVHGGGGLWIYRWGQILAEGTVEQPITFQSDRLEPFYAELPGQWDRIWINDGPAGQDNLLQNVVVKNALIGVQCETWPLIPNAPTSAAKVVLNNVSIRNCSAAGILSRNYRITSNNLLVGDCGQYGVALTGGGEYFFNHSTIANYWSFGGIRQTPAFIMTNTYQDITGAVQVRAIESSQFLNGIIHGNNGNEFQLDFDNAVPPVFQFEYFMLRTDQATNDPNWFPVQERIYRNQDPGFVSTSDRNFRLTEGSFARNKGTPSTQEAIRDLKGDLRNCDGGNGFDLGCYEWCP